MYRLRNPNTSILQPRIHRVLSPRSHVLPSSRLYSSGSPTAGNPPPEEFTKTGKKPQDPTEINGRSYEYSQSGGDEMVAAQQSASFKNVDGQQNDPLCSKEVAGRGNEVNPLEFSPASPELSRVIEKTEVSQNEVRDESQRTGQGVSRKAKTVKKTKIDFKVD